KGYRKFFLVGSESLYPRVANVILGDAIRKASGTVVGAEYVPVGETAVEEVAGKIARLRPDVVLSTIRGGTNVAFFRELRAKCVTPDRTPVVSFGLNALVLANANHRHMAGNYVSWSYHQNLPGEANEAFVNHFRERYGE